MLPPPPPPLPGAGAALSQLRELFSDVPAAPEASVMQGFCYLLRPRRVTLWLVEENMLGVSSTVP